MDLTVLSWISPIYQSNCTKNEDCTKVFNQAGDRISTHHWCYKDVLTTLVASSSGVCLPCWRCCLYPELYGECPQECRCTTGQVCSNSKQCSDGLFCRLYPVGVAQCEGCSNCISDDYEYDGQCKRTCMANSVQSNVKEIQSQITSYYFSLYTLRDTLLYQGLNDVQLDTSTPVWRTLRPFNLELSDDQATFLDTALDIDKNGKVELQELAQSLIGNLQGTSFLCNVKLGESTVNYKGCPCVPGSKTTGLCTAGHRCDKDQSAKGLSDIFLPGWDLKNSGYICVTCRQGEYCPAGSYAGQLAGDDVAENWLCPAGHYCPTPAKRIPCEAGNYCVEGSTKPLTCTFSELLETNPHAIMAAQPRQVLEVIYSEGRPAGGNVCLEKSVSPMAECPAGHYCPQADEKVTCPEGHFCPALSIQPEKCPLQSVCPRGTTEPVVSINYVIILAVSLLVAALLFFLVSYCWRIFMGKRNDRKLGNDQILFELRRVLYRLRTKAQIKEKGSYADIQEQQTIHPLVYVKFKELGLDLRSGKVALQSISGHFAPGEMTAIMGPSGCGKTTFLNVLSGKAHYGKVRGQVLINNQTVPATQLQKVQGFVPQDDTVHEDLTVSENLRYSAKLRLPGSRSNSMVYNLVGDVMQKLHITHIQDSIVGSVENRGISGGQRKRVNIGVELVANPSVLLLDEPTSGLDATSSMEVLRGLDNMCAVGMTIITVIHQPRWQIFELFDQVLILGQGGFTVYQGPPQAVQKYFQFLGFKCEPNENVADFALDVTSGKIKRDGDAKFVPSQLKDMWLKAGKQWVQRYRSKSPQKTRELNKESSVSPAVTELLMNNFDLIDEDGTDDVSAKELYRFFKYYLGLQDISLNDVKLFVAEIDTDGSMSVCKQEIIDMLTKSEATQELAPAAIAIDQDGDAGDDQNLRVDTFFAKEFNQSNESGNNSNPTISNEINDASNALERNNKEAIRSQAGSSGQDQAQKPHKSGRKREKESSGGKHRRPKDSSDRPRRRKDGVHDQQSQSPTVSSDVSVPKARSKSPETRHKKGGSREAAAAGVGGGLAAGAAGIAVLHASNNDSDNPGVAELQGMPSTDDRATKLQHNVTSELAANVDNVQIDLQAPSANQAVLQVQSGSAQQVSQSPAQDAAQQAGDTPGPSQEGLGAAGQQSKYWKVETKSRKVVNGQVVEDVSRSAHSGGAPPLLAIGNIQAQDTSGQMWNIMNSPHGSVQSVQSPTGEQVTNNPMWSGANIVGVDDGALGSTAGTGASVNYSQLPPDFTEVPSNLVATGEPQNEGERVSNASSASVDFGQFRGSIKRPVGEGVAGAGVQSESGESGDIESSGRILRVWGQGGSGSGIIKPLEAVLDGDMGWPIAEGSEQKAAKTQRIKFDESVDLNKTAGSLAVTGSGMSMTMTPKQFASWKLHDIHEELDRIKPPGFLQQFWSVSKRAFTKQRRDFYPTMCVEMGMLLIGACVVGSVQGVHGAGSVQRIANSHAMAMTTLGVLSTVVHLKTFSRDRVLQWREASRGLSTFASFLGMTAVDFLLVLFYPIIFLGPYYSLTQPKISFLDYYIVAVAVSWWSSGAAYVISSILHPNSVLVTGAFLSIIFGAFLNGLDPSIATARGSFLTWVINISYNRWATEALSIVHLVSLPEHMKSLIIVLMKEIGFCRIDTLIKDNNDGELQSDEVISLIKIADKDLNDCIKQSDFSKLMLVLQGALLRILAIFFQQILYKDKKR